MTSRTPTRRMLLGSAPALAIAAVPLIADVAAGATKPNDEPLLSLLAQIDDLEAQWAASVDISGCLLPRSAEQKRLEAQENAIRAQQEVLIAQVNSLPTYTLAGFQARARTILSQTYGEFDDEFRGMLVALTTQLAAIDPGQGGLV